MKYKAYLIIDEDHWKYIGTFEGDKEIEVWQKIEALGFNPWDVILIEVITTKEIKYNGNQSNI